VSKGGATRSSDEQSRSAPQTPRHRHHRPLRASDRTRAQRHSLAATAATSAPRKCHWPNTRRRRARRLVVGGDRCARTPGCKSGISGRRRRMTERRVVTQQTEQRRRRALSRRAAVRTKAGRTGAPATAARHVAAASHLQTNCRCRSPPLDAKRAPRSATRRLDRPRDARAHDATHSSASPRGRREACVASAAITTPKTLQVPAPPSDAARRAARRLDRSRDARRRIRNCNGVASADVARSPRRQSRTRARTRTQPLPC
jgi:hypothetical protein